MAKNVVYPYITLTQFIDEPILKRFALFFDKIYIGEGRLNHLMNINPGTHSEHKASLEYEQSVWQFLTDKGIVKTYPFISPKNENVGENEETNVLWEQFKNLLPKPDLSKSPVKEDIEKMRSQLLSNFFVSHDIIVRMDALGLRKIYPDEFYPAVRTAESYVATKEDKKENIQEKRSDIIQFLLNDIPEPATNTPWEQIIDFRSDEDVKNRYLALINWVNKTSASSNSLSDIKDEYEYLYNDYIKHFKLHKLKYNNTILELIVTAGAGMLIALQSGQFASSFKNLLTMNLSHIKLLEEESKIPGKEIAYIYHAKQKFNSNP